MAQKISVILIDDIDGNDADETVSFALDGASYEIDLSSANAAKLREALAPYVGHARKVAGTARRAARRSTKSVADVRAWAESQGYELASRGRIPREIQAAYDAAH